MFFICCYFLSAPATFSFLSHKDSYSYLFLTTSYYRMQYYSYTPLILSVVEMKFLFQTVQVTLCTTNCLKAGCLQLSRLSLQLERTAVFIGRLISILKWVSRVGQINHFSKVFLFWLPRKGMWKLVWNWPFKPSSPNGN